MLKIASLPNDFEDEQHFYVNNLSWVWICRSSFKMRKNFIVDLFVKKLKKTWDTVGVRTAFTHIEWYKKQHKLTFQTLSG